MKLSRSPLAPDRFPDLPQISGLRAATGAYGFYRARDADRDDVFLFAFPPGTSCAGVFTRSTTASADVKWCRDALKSGGGRARALIVNAGNSNAFTGHQGGLKNAATLAALGTAFGAGTDQYFLAATGVIGEPLPDPNGIGALVPGLKDQLASPDWLACARAFMTTDTFPKGAGASTEIGTIPVHLSGLAKGSGMIAPNMATMLAYIFTDAAIAPDVLDTLLRRATEASFNAITVDGDTSTSDSFMVFATGASGAPMIDHADDPRLEKFAAALTAVSLDLAQQVVRDGEGATKFVTLHVRGAPSDRSARLIAGSIANSPLVKTALAANDANWGRIVMAVGKSGEPVDVDLLGIWFDSVEVARNGQRSEQYCEQAATDAVAKPSLQITVEVGHGPGRATVYTCDLTHGYVDINGAYRT